MTTAELAAQRSDASLLKILWLASPALPVGGFSYSEGLEAAVDAGLVHDESSATTWLIDQMHLGLSRADLAVAAQAIPAWRAHDMTRIAALNAWVLHTRETAELRLQTEQMGRSLLEWARQLGELGAGVFEQLQAARLDPPTYPVACACAAACTDGSVRDSLLGYAFGWAENMVQAAIKSVPLGQSAGQRMLARLAQQIPEAVDHALSLDDASRQAFTPLLAILSARHETQYSRLFRS
ncbi:urease accessory protein UreF [Hydrogenophaga sp. BPS33]|uniref:urease accessory protein UreF n=1 Tax=Hydrogenophaga sp. BPS33 TaxID=2651974 RepID=UPI00131F586B|nr:urease accessory protein UreF [Hydrogenophaga sp. BPS33]QHE85037.1 urease accessory protein UreF [Hydrogenophaga sp. BPS33]